MERVEITEEWRRKPVIMPLTQAFPEFKDVREFRSRNVIFNQDRSRLFNVVSRNYQLVDHVETVNLIESALSEAFGTAPEIHVRSFAGGARVRAEFVLSNAAPVNLGDGDLVYPRLLMFNAHDGAWRFSINLGAWRQVCSNGAIIGVRLASFSSKHLKSLGDGSQFAERVEEVVSKFQLLKDVWQEWKATEVQLEWARPKLVDLFPKRYTDSMLDPARWPMNKWTFYNMLTAMSTHHTRSINRRVEFDMQIARMFYDEDESPTMQRFAAQITAPAEELEA